MTSFHEFNLFAQLIQISEASSTSDFEALVTTPPCSVLIFPIMIWEQRSHIFFCSHREVNHCSMSFVCSYRKSILSRILRIYLSKTNYDYRVCRRIAQSRLWTKWTEPIVKSPYFPTGSSSTAPSRRYRCSATERYGVWTEANGV